MPLTSSRYVSGPRWAGSSRVRTFIAAERWPQVQAALRGEAPTRRQQPQVVDRVRMVEIDDSDEDGN